MTSPLRVDEALTARVAELARLKLEPSELASITAQLREVLAYVDQLQAVSVEGIEPLYRPIHLETPLREDVAREFPRASTGEPATVAAAVEKEAGGFRVPAVL